MVFYWLVGVMEMHGVEWNPVAIRKTGKTIEGLEKSIETIIMLMYVLRA